MEHRLIHFLQDHMPHLLHLLIIRAGNAQRSHFPIGFWDIHPSTKLLAFLCGVQLRLTKPQLQHVLRLVDALIVSEARHKTIAGLYRLIVDAPDPSNGADTLRISPWTAEDLRAPLRHFIVADLVAYAHQTDEWTLYVSLDDSLGEKDKDTRHLEAVAYHHEHTQSQGKKKPHYTNGTVHVAVR